MGWNRKWDHVPQITIRRRVLSMPRPSDHKLLRECVRKTELLECHKQSCKILEEKYSLFVIINQPLHFVSIATSELVLVGSFSLPD